MPKRKVRGARAPGTGPPLPPPPPSPPLLRLCGARIGAGPSRLCRQVQELQTVSGGPELTLRGSPVRGRQRPYWKSGGRGGRSHVGGCLSRSPRARRARPAPPPPLAAPPLRGRAIQIRKGGKEVLGVGGRGNALPPKNRRRERRVFVVWPRLRPRPGHTRLAPLPPTSSPGCARASRLPPSTAAIATALEPRLRRGLFAPAAAVAFAWCSGMGCAALRTPAKRALPWGLLVETPKKAWILTACALRPG